LYRNDTTVGSGNPVSDVNVYGAGFYNYSYYTVGNDNYTAAIKQFNLTIFQNQTNPIDLILVNSTQELRNQNMTVEYEQQVNVTDAIIYENAGNLEVYRDEVNVTDTEMDKWITLGANTNGYVYKANTTGNQNYTSNETDGYYIFVNKKQTLTYLWINDTRKNYGVTLNDYANFTVELSDYPGRDVELWTNYSDSVWKRWDDDISPLQNITQMTSTGNFEFLGNYSGDENYTYSEESWIVTVSVLNLEAKIVSLSPTSINQSQNSTIVGNCSCDGGTCNNAYMELLHDGESIPTAFGNDLQVNGSNPISIGSLSNSWTTRIWNITGWKPETYGIRVKCNSTETGNSFSDPQNLEVNDTESPVWYGEGTYSTSGSEYVKDRQYQFNVSWDDNKEISTVLIEHNFSGGSPQNETVSTNDSSIYYFYIYDIPAGTYVWKEYANDMTDNWNVTNDGNYWVYTVEKNTSTEDFMNLTINLVQE